MQPLGQPGLQACAWGFAFRDQGFFGRWFIEFRASGSGSWVLLWAQDLAVCELRDHSGASVKGPIHGTALNPKR